MFEIDNENIKKLESDLKNLKERAIPFATRKTLNDVAFKAQAIAKADIERDMILRNRYTQQSIRVERAKTLDIKRQSASIGSTADYLEMQEFGGIEQAKGKGLVIPTSYAAGMSEGAKPRTKLPRKPNQMRNIQLERKKRTAKSKKQRMVFTVQDAVESGKRIVYMDLGRTKGIFRVIGGKKGQARGWPQGAKLKMLHDLSRQSVNIPANPWLKPAFEEAGRMLPAFYADALRFQLRRHGLK